MCSSQNIRKDIVLSLYRDSRTVFRLIDVAMLVEETNLQILSKKLNYYVSKGKLKNPRRGIYTKPEYNQEELACRIYAPSYISLDFVLQKAGIVYQFDTRITTISYLSRRITVENKIYRYRKIKGIILSNTTGINQQSNHVNTASPERAFLDMLYLEPGFYFDNINPIDIELTKKMLHIYQSKTLNRRINEIFINV